MDNTMLIKAVPYIDLHTQERGYILRAGNGDMPTEYYIYPSKLAAYLACERLYPASSVWQGCMTHKGYRITI